MITRPGDRSIAGLADDPTRWPVRPGSDLDPSLTPTPGSIEYELPCIVSRTLESATRNDDTPDPSQLVRPANPLPFDQPPDADGAGESGDRLVGRRLRGSAIAAGRGRGPGRGRAPGGSPGGAAVAPIRDHHR